MVNSLFGKEMTAGQYVNTEFIRFKQEVNSGVSRYKNYQNFLLGQCN